MCIHMAHHLDATISILLYLFCNKLINSCILQPVSLFDYWLHFKVRCRHPQTALPPPLKDFSLHTINQRSIFVASWLVFNILYFCTIFWTSLLTLCLFQIFFCLFCYFSFPSCLHLWFFLTLCYLVPSFPLETVFLRWNVTSQDWELTCAQ